MGKINNEKITKRIIEETKVNIAEGIPQQLSNVIAPVIVANEQPQIQIADKSSAGALFTASTTKRTFITSLSIAASSNAQSADREAAIVTTPKGKASTSTICLKISSGAADENNDAMSVIYPFPYEIEKGSSVTLSFTTSTARANCSYYEIDSIERK